MACGSGYSRKDYPSEGSTLIEPPPGEGQLDYENAIPLWHSRVEAIDFQAYSKRAANNVCTSQARACLSILEAAVDAAIERESARASGDLAGARDVAHDVPSLRDVCLGIMYATTIEETSKYATNVLRRIFTSTSLLDSIRLSIVDFLSTAHSRPVRALDGLQLLVSCLQSTERVSSINDIASDLCGACSSTSWDERSVVQTGMRMLMKTMGKDWNTTNEIKLVSAAFAFLKSIPREISDAVVDSVDFFLDVCSSMYGEPACLLPDDDQTIRDSLELCVDSNSHSALNSKYSANQVVMGSPSRPSDAVVRLVISEIASSQQIVR
jgi:hypothetical protein